MAAVRKLTPRQEKFCALYLELGNGTAAAIGAGYPISGAGVAAHHLLKNPKVRARIDKPLETVVQRAQLTRERVLEEMRRLAFTDIRSFYDERGAVKPVSAWTEEMGSQVAATETIIKNARAGDGVTDEVLKLKTHDKVRVLEMLGKHFKLLTDVVQVIDADKLNARLLKGRAQNAKRVKA